MDQQRYSKLIAAKVPADAARILSYGKGELPKSFKDTFVAMGKLYAELAEGVIVLSSEKSCGKTLAACAFLCDPVRCKNPKRFDGQWDANARPLFFSYLQLLTTDFKEFYNLTEPGVLVLDDLGAGLPEHAFMKSLIFGIVQQRAHLGLLTIITTRLEEKELAKRYGKRFVELIHTHGRLLTF